MVRDHGVNLAFTPMWHANKFREADEGYLPSQREVDGYVYDTHVGGQADRPLIAQLCAIDKEDIVHAAKRLEPYVDGIDLNCKSALVSIMGMLRSPCVSRHSGLSSECRPADGLWSLPHGQP